MASHLFTYGASQSAPAPTPALSTVYTPRSLAQSYLSDPTHRYLSGSDPLSNSSMYLAGTDGLGAYSDAARATSYMMSSWPAPDAELGPPGFKRTSEALYHQALLGAHNPIGQMEAWYSTNSLAKRPRFENTSLPIYPQRPGEKDCVHYMQTRTCKFGECCKFDHPIWVPDGGIQDWKEVPLVAPSESLPERPGAPDCPYFLKTQRCKFVLRCKFNHPKDKLATAGASENGDVYALPERPSEPACAYYMKTGECKYGAQCRFHHPIDRPAVALSTTKPSQQENVKLTLAGLPRREGAVICVYYLKTGTCKYGATCRFDHPPPGEVVAMAASQAKSDSTGGKA
ncbi:putative transcription factor C3H family [Rosa chinensis]|uniref:Putative transcription factor C3H family n=1 Tax=Rosa chinensis TaxID=74649 RepID=A0A2P6Q7X9_ROSCH|nr:zinc finger CCCH domain-containing protein 37 isoform X2 [Rosa chinensis]PRQ30282.1 putative transcription factor C3H family [Rosa chinensis]